MKKLGCKTNFEKIVFLASGESVQVSIAAFGVKAELDSGVYPKGIKITDEEMATLNLVRHTFHGEWNYSLHPRAG